MKNEIKILIISDKNTVHLQRLVTHLKKLNPALKFDIFNISKNVDNVSTESSVFNRVIQPKRHFPNWIYKISFLLPFFSRFLDFRLSFSKAFKETHYDIINIHFVSVESFFLMPLYKKKAKTILTSPWGSDMYRNKGLYKWMVRKVLDWSTWVSAPKIQFREDIKRIHKVPEAKFVNLGFGSDMIDLIIEKEQISREDAKTEIGLSDKYLITCGYNGLKPQRHPEIIQALARVKDKLPENLHLLLPMTYGAPASYISKIENLLKNHQFQYTIYDTFLSDNDLFFIRKAADMFIHAQPSDAFSASMQEYMLCDTIIVNGNWTRYPDLEKFGIPFYLYYSFEELPACILKAYRQEEDIRISPELKTFIREKGWKHLAKEWNKAYQKFADNS